MATKKSSARSSSRSKRSKTSKTQTPIKSLHDRMVNNLGYDPYTKPQKFFGAS